MLFAVLVSRLFLDLSATLGFLCRGPGHGEDCGKIWCSSKVFLWQFWPWLWSGSVGLSCWASRSYPGSHTPGRTNLKHTWLDFRFRSASGRRGRRRGRVFETRRDKPKAISSTSTHPHPTLLLDHPILAGSHLGYHWTSPYCESLLTVPSTVECSCEEAAKCLSRRLRGSRSLRATVIVADP